MSFYYCAGRKFLLPYLSQKMFKFPVEPFAGTKVKKLFLLFIFFSLGSSLSSASHVPHILIVTDMNEEPYKETIVGFKDELSAYAKVSFTKITMSQVSSSAAGQDIRRLKPDLIFALGSEAITWANLGASRIPVVTTLFFNDKIFEQSAHLAGIRMNYPFTTQFKWLRQFFPGQKTVAILFNPIENADTVEVARKAGRQQGFKIVGIPVEKPENLPFALDQLTNNIEILLSIPDHTVMTVNTAKEILLTSFRDKVPLVGLSDNWVRSGAVYGLSWDFADLGRQCAEISKKILQGAPAHAIPPEYPRKLTYTINTKVAEHMKITIPPYLLNNAKLVFN